MTDVIASGRGVDEVISAVAIELTDLLSLRHCHFERGRPDAGVAHIERTGEVSFGAVRWEAGTQGLPGPGIDLPVHAVGELVGRYVLVPNPGVAVS